MILSQKTKIYQTNKRNKQIELPVEVWTPSLATICIMAVSANYPVIMLNILDLFINTSGVSNDN